MAEATRLHMARVVLGEVDAWPSTKLGVTHTSWVAHGSGQLAKRTGAYETK